MSRLQRKTSGKKTRRLADPIFDNLRHDMRKLFRKWQRLRDARRRLMKKVNAYPHNGR